MTEPIFRTSILLLNRNEGAGKSLVKVTINHFLEKELKSHLSKMKTMKNGNLYKMVIAIVDKSLLELVLKETSGNQTQASQILGITRNTLRKKVQEYKIKLPKVS